MQEGIIAAGLAMAGWAAWVTRSIYGNKNKIDQVCVKLDLLLQHFGLKEKESE